MSRRRESNFPAPGKVHTHSLSKKMCRFSRRRGKLCPGAGKAVSRRRGKVTFMHCRRKCVGFPGAKGSCARRRKVLERGSGKVPEQGSGENVILSAPGAGGSCVPALGKLFPGPGKVTFIHSRRKMCKFSWRRGKLCPESCFPAPGKAVSWPRESYFPVSQATAGLIRCG